MKRQNRIDPKQIFDLTVNSKIFKLQLAFNDLERFFSKRKLFQLPFILNIYPNLSQFMCVFSEP